MLLLGAFALILSIVVTAVIYREISSRLEFQPASPDNIVVARAPLRFGVLLAEEHLTTAPWPPELKLEGTFKDPQEILGRGVLFPISLNEPVLESKLAPRGSGAGLSAGIPEGKRAVAVRVDNVSGVAGFVLPQARVDVILSGSPEGGRIDYARAILENIEVLSAGQNVEYDAQGKPQNVPVVTLLVTPEQAQALSLAAIDGRIQLTLRNPLDADQENPLPVRRTALYSQPNTVEEPEPAPTRARRPRPRPAPVFVTPPPPPKIEVELIEGSNRKTLKFDPKDKTGDSGSSGSN
jgi:pilus assembly protein CpaB